MKKDQGTIHHKKFEPIAIVSVGAIFPGANEAEGFWRQIVDAKDLLKEVPETHWRIEDYYHPNPSARDKTYCKRGAFISDQAFDPIEYGIPPQTIPAIDTSQLLALMVAKEVLGEGSELQFQKTNVDRISVILGGSTLEAIQYVSARMQRPVWEKSLYDFGIAEADVEKICSHISSHFTEWQESTFPGLLTNVIAGRVANRFNLGGTNCTVDAACAGSLAALSMSISELQMGSADMVITGGVDTLNDIVMFMCFSKTPALSLSGDCRPFSSKADGTMLGEGIGMFALKRLADAERDGNTIYALIRGVGTSSDGRSKSIYAPLSHGQSKAILRAYAQAGFDTHSIGLIEAHGTGTKAGDTAELNGLKLAFGTSSYPYCALGSIKSQIGHTKSAAGSAGLFKAVMALHHKVLPATLKIEKPNTELDWKNAAFYLNTQTRPWFHTQKTPRRAGVSSFGFGGSNYHIALEEYTGPNKAKRLRTMPSELIIISGHQVSQLLNQCTHLLNQLSEKPSLAYLAYTTQKNFLPESLARLSIVAHDLWDLKQKLQSAISMIQSAPKESFAWSKGVYYGYACNPGKVAILLKGKGNEYLNMGIDLAMHFSIAFHIYQDTENQSFIFPQPSFEADAEKQAQASLNQHALSALTITRQVQLALLNHLEIYADYTVGDETTFSDQIEKCYQSGVRTFIEVGPQQIKNPLIENDYWTIAIDNQNENGVTQLWHALAHALSIGLNPKLLHLWEDYAIPIAPKKTSAFCIMINGTNYGRPYPANAKNTEKYSLSWEKKEMPENPSYLHLYQDLQKQLVEAHNAYQKAMAESHIAFLNSITQLAGQLSGNPAQIPAQPIVQPAPIIQPIPVVQTPPIPIIHNTASIMTPPPIMQTPAPIMENIPPQPMVAPPQPIASSEDINLKNLLLNVVTEKTGYPVEMLNMDMGIEADLGIDSIKRVEILAALTERVPKLPEIAPSELSQLKTLGDIVTHMEKHVGIA